MKSAQIRSFFCLYFPAFGLNMEISPYSARMQKNTDQKKLRIWTLFTQCPLFKFPVKKTICLQLQLRQQ